MSTLSPCAPAVKGKSRPKRTLAYNALIGALFLTVGPKEYGYWLDALPHDFDSSIRCYRLTKFCTTRKPDEPDAYDVMLDPDGSSCECKGHLRHGHKTTCKHIAALRTLRERGSLS